MKTSYFMSKDFYFNYLVELYLSNVLKIYEKKFIFYFVEPPFLKHNVLSYYVLKFNDIYDTEFLTIWKNKKSYSNPNYIYISVKEIRHLLFEFNKMVKHLWINAIYKHIIGIRLMQQKLKSVIIIS